MACKTAKFLTSVFTGTALLTAPMGAQAGGMSQIGTLGHASGPTLNCNPGSSIGRPGPSNRAVTTSINTLNISKPFTVNNNVNVYKPVNVNNNLNVQTNIDNSKRIDINKPVSVNKNIDVNKPVSVNKNVDVNKPVSINKNVDVNKPVSVNKNVDINKPVSINKNIDINKPISITKNIDNSKNINITNNIDNSKYINASKNINIDKTIIINKGGGNSQSDAQAEAIAIASAFAAAMANSNSSSSAVVNFNGSGNSSSNANANSSSVSSASAFGYSGSGTMIGGSSYIAESPGPFAGGDLGAINVEIAPAAPAQCTFQDTTVVKAIHAVCISADKHEFPASHMVPDTWINSSYEGEVARCIPGSHLKIIVGKVMQSSEGMAAAYTSGQVLECGLHEAVRHYKDGALKCAPSIPVPDCTERTNLRKYGTGDMFFSYRAKVCLETHEEYPAIASIAEDRR